jgi:transposase
LYEAANVILTRPVKGSSLKSWAMRVAKRADSDVSRPPIPI